MVSMHTSPAAMPGTADAGSMNVTLLGLAAELAIRDVQVDLVTRASGPPAASVLLPGVTLHELPAGEPGPVPTERLSEVSDEFGEAVAALSRRDSGRYDVIHAYHWLSGIATLPVAIELGLPFVQSFHSLAVMSNAAASRRYADEPLQRLRSETFLATQADAVVATSSAEAAALIDDVGATANRTWIIPPGVDLGLFSPRLAGTHAALRRNLGLEADRPLVVIAGRVRAAKGHELAVRALAELHAMRGWAPLLVVAGEAAPADADFAASLRSLAGDLGVATDVRFVGALHRDVLADLLSAAAVTLMPSYSESFGLVALESAASGTPVLGARVGGLPESIEDGVSGILLDSHDPRYWATELAILLENDERRAALGATARTHAERFTWGAAATSLLGVYAGVKR